MKQKIFAASAFCLFLLIPGCSSKNSTSPAKDDTIAPKEMTTRAVVLDSAQNIRVLFKSSPLPAGDSLWITTTEITQAQYHALFPASSVVAAANPVSVNWYDAARFALKFTDFAKTVIGDTGVLLRPVYDTTGGPETFKPTRLRIASKVAVSATPKAADEKWFQRPAFNAVIKVCSLRVDTSLAIDTVRALYRAALAVLPDSFFIVKSGAPVSLVFSTADLRSGRALDSLTALTALWHDSLTVQGFRHDYISASDSALFGDHADTGTVPRLFKLDEVVGALPDTFYVIYFFAPDTSAAIYLAEFPVPDTVYDYPLTYNVTIWKSDTLKSGFRLPSVDEWEAIARCGLDISYSTYNGGLGALGAVFGTSSASPVASLKPNPWGLFDLTGNVAEWTNDWWNNYDRYSFILPGGNPDSSKAPFKTVKGGSFKSVESDSTLLISFNSSALPDSTNKGTIGFRLVAPVAAYWDSLPVK